MTQDRGETGTPAPGAWAAAGTDAGPPRISVAVMHHPHRGPSVTDLVASCLPLDARVVMDPDPAGPPSPLRTAKLAWAAVGPEATHHLVLQDDVTLCSGFAEQLTAAVTQRDDHALALYTNWNSPHNAYLVRCAAVAGQSWAPLGHHEWVPTLGLVLPAEAARQLASYLERFPDDFRDDDELVVGFCAQEGYPVTASVPHLLEHGAGPSLAGNDSHGPRHATVPVGDATPPVEHWRRPGPRVFPPRTGTVERLYAVELRDSRCSLRLLRPEVEEPLEHPFGWDWSDWAGWAGADPDRMRSDLAAVEGRLGPDSPKVLSRPARTEVAAAAWLLGHDVSRTAWGRPPGPVRTRDRDEALRSWIRSGLAPHDTAGMTPEVLDGTVEWALGALDLGRRAGEGSAARGRGGDGNGNCSDRPARTRGAVTVTDLNAWNAVSEMAVREATVLTGSASQPPPTWVLVHACPWCGATPVDHLPDLAARHSGGGALSYLAASDTLDITALPGADEQAAVVEMLACERPTVRGLLALAHGLREHGITWYESRSTALLTLLSGASGGPGGSGASGGPGWSGASGASGWSGASGASGASGGLCDSFSADPSRVLDLLPGLARAEAVWWDSTDAVRPAGKAVLPVSFSSADGEPDAGPSRFLTAHATSPVLDALARTYRRIRFDAAKGRL